MIRSLRSLTVAQRKALALIRAAKAAAGTPAAGQDSWAGLAALADGLLLDAGICQPAATLVSAPELHLLGALATCQRRAFPPAKESARERALAEAAACLTGLDIRLPVPGIAREAGPEGAPCLPSPSGAGPRRPAFGTARSRIVALLGERGSLYRHEVLGLGISRQYLSVLLKDGTLVRAGQGRFRLPAGDN